MRADPGATPQIFSRIVVLPALALPMMRIRKQGHLDRSWSIVAVVFLSTAVVAISAARTSGESDLARIETEMFI